jgi:HK97 family phage portal protein
MAFVVSAGELRAIERGTTLPAYSLRIGQDQFRDYAQLWRMQPELRTVVDFIARNLAQLGLHVFRRVSDVERVRLVNHPLTDLLDTPNPSTTAYRMIDALVHDLCIYDDAYWLKVRQDGPRGKVGPPLNLRRIRPNRISANGDDWLEPSGYTIVGSRGKLDVDASSVVHFRGYNPTDDRHGSAPIESLRQILSEEWAANVYREQLWRNGARMAGYISRPADAPEWGNKGRDRFRDEFQSTYSGDSGEAGGVVILEDGMSFVPSAITPRDSQYIESRKLTREEVARSYHVPLPMVGILDHATFTNVKELHKNLYQDCLGPWMENIQQEIELQLVPDLPDTVSVYVEFNIAAKLNGSFEEQAAQLQSAVGGPYMTRNEARARLNLPMLDGGNDIIVPLNVSVGAQPAALPASPQSQPAPKTLRQLSKARAPQEHTDKATATLVRFFTRQGAAVLSRIGAEKARGAKATLSDVFEFERWNTELSADLLGIMRKIALSAAQTTMAAMGLAEGDFDTELIAPWLVAHAEGVAQAVNTATSNQLADVLNSADEPPLADLDALFNRYISARAGQIAETLTSSLSGFGTVEAGKHYGGDGTTKTWITGSNPRPEHAAMDGQTVPIDGEFSDGSRWPGDAGKPSLDSNCNCDVSVAIPA